MLAGGQTSTRRRSQSELRCGGESPDSCICYSLVVLVRRCCVGAEQLVHPFEIPVHHCAGKLLVVVDAVVEFWLGPSLSSTVALNTFSNSDGFVGSLLTATLRDRHYRPKILRTVRTRGGPRSVRFSPKDELSFSVMLPSLCRARASRAPPRPSPGRQCRVQTSRE